jgi:glycosyltransferase involved in cell wall biosynthesis
MVICDERGEREGVVVGASEVNTKTPNRLECSVIIPCYNEEESIQKTISEIDKALDGQLDYELIVVNDGSTDRSAFMLNELKTRFSRMRVVDHAINRGYGAALKSGIRAANAQLIAITDADGTYPNDRLPELIRECANKDMVVGARVGPGVSYSKLRAIPKFFLKRWISFIAARDVPDINSGMRVFRKDVCERFFNILPNTFSFTITITLAMLTTFRAVSFVPISYAKREGHSKIRPFADTWRFIRIILRTGVYFAPIRAFFPLLLALSSCAVLSIAYDILILDDLTEKSLMLMLFSINTGMFILVADMIDKRVAGV